MKPAEYKRAFDISNYQGVPPLEWFEARKAEGFERVILGTQDMKITNGQIVNAYGAGLKVDLYAMLYWDQAEDMELLRNIKQQLPETATIWLDCEIEYPGSPDHLTFDLVELMGLAAPGEGLVGIYTRSNWWQSFAGNTEVFGPWPLWDAFYNGVPNFDYFVPYGGWSAPTMKQYAVDVILDGVRVDLNCYKEDEI